MRFPLFSTATLLSTIAFVGTPNEALGIDYHVTTTDEFGTGSFREAIKDANASPGLDWIIFDTPPFSEHKLWLPLPKIEEDVSVEGNGNVIDASIGSIFMVGHSVFEIDAMGTTPGSATTIQNLLVKGCYGARAFHVRPNRRLHLLDVSIFEFNDPVDPSGAYLSGPALFCERADCLLRRVAIYDTGSAVDGGAVSHIADPAAERGSTLQIFYSQIWLTHAAGKGGAIHVVGLPDTFNSAYSLSLTKSTIMWTHADDGGALFLEGARGYLNGATLSQCSAGDQGGHVYVTAESTFRSYSSTLLNGSAGDPISGADIHAEPTALLYWYNSIIGHFKANTIGASCNAGMPTAVGNGNLYNDEPQACSINGSGNIKNNDFNIDPVLRQNGAAWPVGVVGIMWSFLTHAIEQSSPAVDRGDAVYCQGFAATDARDYQRADTCDIGAFEYDGQP